MLKNFINSSTKLQLNQYQFALNIRKNITNFSFSLKKCQHEQSKFRDIANLLRIDAVKAIHVTKSGHPTSCSSIAQILSVLFFHESGLKFHWDRPSHFSNDRLVLSKGHAAPIFYSALFRAKMISYEQLTSLRKKDSIFEGHPTPKVPFVDVGTGSLGQGLSVAAGMAYSSKYFDKIKNKIYCITGDGEMAEGNIWQAVDFAQHYQLNNLTLMLDMNRLGQTGSTMHGHNSKVYRRRLEAFGWRVREIDGHIISEIIESLNYANKEEKCENGKSKPTAIICKTVKGKNLGIEIQNQQNWHGKDLGNRNEKSIQILESMIQNKNVQFVTFAPKINQSPHSKHDKVIKNVKITPNYKKDHKISTRKAYGLALAKATSSNPNIITLDAQTKNSSFAITLQQAHPNNFIQCFIAEQNMIGVAIGLSCRNKIPFCSSFGAFLMRAVDQIRIAGISGSNIKIVGSHAGCSIGEDGPSQMALQDLGIYRNIPNALVSVPSDGVSMEKAVELAANYNQGPCYIRTSRPDLPIIYPNNQQFEIGKCKIIRSSQKDSVLLVSYGVTVHQCLKSFDILKKQGINARVIDVFCIKPLDKQKLKQNIKQCNGKLIVVQDHYEAGGLYEAICGIQQNGIIKAKHLCVRRIPGSASPNQQLQMSQINEKSITKIVKQLISQ